MIILALDPGATTGYCLVDDSTGFGVVSVGEIPWDSRLGLLTALIGGTSAHNGLLQPQAVVVEAFRLRPGRAMEQVGSIFPSVRIIGIIEALLYQRPDRSKVPLVFQEPGIMARVEVLPEHADLFVGMPHAKDAYKHARYYTLTTREHT
jgi:hypothetical protein